MMSLEDLLKNKAAQLYELQLTTVLIQHRKSLAEQLSQAHLEMATIMKGINCMRQDLETMKDQNVKYRNFSAMLTKLDAHIVCIDEHLPAELIAKFVNLSQAASPYTTKSNGIETPDQCQLVKSIVEMDIDTPEPRMTDCKKNLFSKAADSYSMDLLSAEEFSKIPKYMIGRQSITTLNEFITAINQTLESKYSLLAVGKNVARKKGKLDLYLSLKREEIVVGPGEDPIYFFTAEDYYRQTQSKLDKTKLNLITVLRHCKRLRELRAGKTVQYALVPARERCKGEMFG